jgi:hypothetical protein
VIGRTSWLGAVAVIAACTGSSTEMGSDPIARSASCRDKTLAWGSGPSQVGLVPGGDEFLARGPQAVAVGSDPNSDSVFVLDSVNGRVLALDGSAVRIAVDGIARDADALAIGPDGTIAVYSSLKATAWIFDRDGAPAGSVAIDRSLRETVGISLGQSHQVVVRSAYQETMFAGSPSAPVSLATTLIGKREGAFLLPDGAGIATRATAVDAANPIATSARIDLLVVTNPAGRRSTIRSSFPIPGDANAAMIAGVAGNTACMRVEQVTQPGERIEVSRRAVCMDATNGRVLADIALARPQPYVPAHELAVGASTLAILQPTADALVVRTCEVSR